MPVLPLIDFVIAVTVAEAVVLALLHARLGRGLPPREFMPALTAGLGLLLAARAGVSGADGLWVAAGLLLAGAAHALDLKRRWR